MMTQTMTAPAVLYVGMPATRAYREAGAHTTVRSIVWAFDNRELPVASVSYEETATGWTLVLVLDSGPAVRVEVDSSHPLPTVAVNDGEAEPVEPSVRTAATEQVDAKAWRIVNTAARIISRLSS